MGVFMTEEVKDQSSLPKDEASLPRNYYVNGDPARVIDRVTDLAKLDGNPHLVDKRLLLAEEIINFCPVVFLDELVRVLATSSEKGVDEEAIKALRDRASNNEIILKRNNSLSEEEKNQLSALAVESLSEKIINAENEQVLRILRFVQQYIKDQLDHQNVVGRQIADLQNQLNQIADKIKTKEQWLVEDQKTIFFDFATRLINSDY